MKLIVNTLELDGREVEVETICEEDRGGVQRDWTEEIVKGRKPRLERPYY